MSPHLLKLNLSQFRCYDTLRLDLEGASTVVLTGGNGAGKTNILEAVSLLTPGRGLRGADILSLKNRMAEAADVWAVAAEVQTKGDVVRIGTGLSLDAKRRTIRIDGKDAKTQNDLAELLSAVWLTPQMDRLFLEGASARRKFLDRLVFSFDSHHAARLNRYDRNLRERMALLTGEKRADPQWLSTLEKEIAADGASVIAARAEMIESLQRHIATLDPLFPRPVMAASEVGASVEELQANRAADRAAGRTLKGAHRADLVVSYAEKDMPASLCSTGEQKALLVSIILAHALMTKAEKGAAPLVLLDEVAAHLDEDRRRLLFDQLTATGAQVWLTGTDESTFAHLNAKFFRVEDARVVERVV